MERVALDAGSLDGGIEELQIEKRVVADEHGARAARRLQLLADFLKQRAQRLAFVDRRPQRMKRIDARHLQRRRIEPRAFERLDDVAMMIRRARDRRLR